MFFVFFVKKVDWKLLFILLLFQILPTIYKTTRIYFLGILPDESTYTIASQILWLNILYEIIIESITVPLFFVFSKMKNDNSFDSRNKTLSLTTYLIFSIFLLFTILIFVNTGNIVDDFISRNNVELFEKTTNYIKYEVWGMLGSSIFSYLFLVLTLFQIRKYHLISFLICLLFTLSTILLDLFLVSNNSYSLQLGINGVGINSIISNFLCSIVLVVYTSFSPIKMWRFNLFKNKQVLDFKLIKKYFSLFLLFGAEVTIRNLFFYFMIIQSIDAINDAETYWVANNFIWNWLLMPLTTFSIFIKQTYKQPDEITNKN